MKFRFLAKLFLAAMLALPLCAAQSPSPAVRKPLTRAQILALLAGDVPSSRVTMLVQQMGVDFNSNDAFLDQVRKAGGEDDLVAALQSVQTANNASAPPAAAGPDSPPAAPATPPNISTPPPSAAVPDAKLDNAKQDELTEHTAHGGDFLRERRYMEAEVSTEPRSNWTRRIPTCTSRFLAT